MSNKRSAIDNTSQIHPELDRNDQIPVTAEDIEIALDILSTGKFADKRVKPGDRARLRTQMIEQLQETNSRLTFQTYGRTLSPDANTSLLGKTYDTGREIKPGDKVVSINIEGPILKLQTAKGEEVSVSLGTILYFHDEREAQAFIKRHYEAGELEVEPEENNRFEKIVSGIRDLLRKIAS